MKNRDDMTFPFEEYMRRLTELRTRMQNRLLDAVVITDPANQLYLTDYQTTGYSYFQALVVPVEDEPFMVTRMLEESNVYGRTWVEKTRTYPDSGSAIQMLVSTLQEFGLTGKRIGYERNSYFFSAYDQDTIHTTLLDSELRDCFGIVEEGRICKSTLELEAMAKAAKATEAGMQAGWDACIPGASENDVGAAIASAMFRAGGENPAVMPYVTSGPRTMLAHASFEGRIIQPGEHVFLEVGGSYRRYHTAMMRTVVMGKLSPSMRQAQDLMKNTLKEMKRLIRPGLTVSDLDNLARKMIGDNEVGAQLITRSGYSIGIAFTPSWDEGYILSIKQGSPEILKEGMTLHLIPWMWGVDGDKTVGISDTIHVTATGCESFFTLDQDFVVKSESASESVS